MRRAANSLGEETINDIKRAIRKQYSSKEKIRIVLDGLCDEDSIVELCRRSQREAMVRSDGVEYDLSRKAEAFEARQ